MLVLTRRKGEQIYVGDDIVITVVDIRGDRVRIGVDTPVGVEVHRREIYERIHRIPSCHTNWDEPINY